MKIVVINGVEHKGSTYNIAHKFIDKLSDNHTQVKEYFLPKDMPHYCKGCGICFTKSEKLCPHNNEISVILKDMENADLIIFASPVYVYHVTGQMKAFLDHFGFMWIVHRPRKSMFKKKALIISTAAGAGTKSANKDIKDSLNFWGVGKIFTYGKNVYSMSWAGVSDKNKQEIENEVEKLSYKIKKSKNSTSLRVKIMFNIFHKLRNKIISVPCDIKYWKEQGLSGKVRPWKDK